MDEKEVYKSCDFFTAFPDADLIAEKDRKYLLPAGIYKYKNPNGSQADILLGIPITDEEGYMSYAYEDSKHSHSESWLTYSFCSGEWSLDCSEDVLAVVDVEDLKWVKNVTLAFKERKEFFLRKGFLNYYLDDEDDDTLPLFTYDAIASSYGNWVSEMLTRVYKHELRECPVIDDLDNEKSVCLFDADGKEFEYIGYLDSDNYAKVLSGTLHYFYEPAKEKVLVIVEHS